MGRLALATERDARKNVQRVLVPPSGSTVLRGNQLLDEAEGQPDKEEKARPPRPGNRPPRRHRRTATATRLRRPRRRPRRPESTLQIRVRVLSQKAEDLKADERKVTTALEQAADAADRAAKVLATRPRPTRLS